MKQSPPFALLLALSLLAAPPVCAGCGGADSGGAAAGDTATGSGTVTSSGGATSGGGVSGEGRVSASRGPEGGVVVLWPRVIPSEGADSQRELAVALQRRMRQVVEQALPGVEIDVRPEPERVCPRAGCLGASMGAVLVHQGDSCVAAATVAPPGPNPSILFAWSDNLELRMTTIPFREPPESQLRVHDFTPCAQLIESLEGRSAEIEAELRRVGGQ